MDGTRRVGGGRTEANRLYQPESSMRLIAGGVEEIDSMEIYGCM